MTENFPEEGIRWANPSRTEIKYWRKVQTVDGVEKLTVYGKSIVEAYRKMQELLKTVNEKKYSFGIDDVCKPKPCKSCPFMYCHGCLHSDKKEVNNVLTDFAERMNNTSGRTGVYWDKFRSKWIAAIGYKGKTYYCGDYESFDDAVKARKFLENNIKGLF